MKVDVVKLYQNYKRNKQKIKVQQECKARWEAYFRNGMMFPEEVKVSNK